MGRLDTGQLPEDEIEQPVTNLEEELKEMETGYRPRDAEISAIFKNYETNYWSIRGSLYGGYPAINPKTGNFVIKIPPGSKPLMTEEGINDIMNKITGFLTSFHSTGNYDKEEVQIRMREFGLDLAYHVLVNLDRFGLTPNTANLLIKQLLYQVEANFTRSIGAKTLNLMLQQEQVRTIRTEEITPPQNKRLFGMF